MDEIEKTLFEKIWEYREEDLYPNLFGKRRRGIFVLTAELFIQVFQQPSYDPRWLSYGVIEFEPISKRNSWLYVTSGASNPWEADSSNYASSEYSGFGTELVIEVTQQSEWAIVTLQRLLAFNILLTVGRYSGSPALDYGDRVPLRRPIDGSHSLLTGVVLTKPTHYPSSFKLLSGRVDFLHTVGITTSEQNYAQEQSSNQLIEQLKLAEAFPVTDPARTAVV